MQKFFSRMLLSISQVTYKQWLIIVAFLVGISLLCFGIIDFAQLIQLLSTISGLAIVLTLGQRSIILLIPIVLGLSSCMSYQKAIRKFGQNTVDTVYVTETITQSVPADSVSYVVPLDHISKLETSVWAQSPNGARVLISPMVHEKTRYIRVEAQCPEKVVKTSITRPRQIITKNTWGVAPVYKTLTYVFGITLLLLAALITLGFVLRKLKLLV